jgi:hypothetical protein
MHGEKQNLQHNKFDVIPFINPGAKTFFGSIENEILTKPRSMKSTDFGFPSGYVSQTAALWGGIALLIRKISLVAEKSLHRVATLPGYHELL